MTTLDLSSGDAQQELTTGVLARVKWSVVVPWAVAVAMFGTNGYHRFLSAEAATISTRQEQSDLRREMAQLRDQVQALTIEVGKLNTAIGYLGGPSARRSGR